MTTELEKQFFDTFGVEPTEEKYCYYQCKNPKFKEYCCEDKNCKHFKHKIEYPQITDRHYLELICAYNNFQNDTASFFIPFDYKNIKNNILTFLVEEINEKYKNRYFCNDVDKLKHQVQAIFKESEQE